MYIFYTTNWNMIVVYHSCSTLGLISPYQPLWSNVNDLILLSFKQKINFFHLNAFVEHLELPLCIKCVTPRNLCCLSSFKLLTQYDLSLYLQLSVPNLNTFYYFLLCKNHKHFSLFFFLI